METAYPLLFFPEPQSSKRTGRRFPFSKPHYPSAERQSELLTPLFDTLERAFNARRMEIRQNPEGLNPEQVVVFETVGSVDDFVIAIKRIEGLEWLGEIEVDDIQPTEDFYDVKNREKPLTGRLFLTMANQRAIDELLSLWRRYSNDTNFQFERGLSGLKSLFERLKDIRRWDIQDRLLETGVIGVWQETLLENVSTIRFELQLWFSESLSKRQQIQQDIVAMIESLNGRCISSSEIPEIAYHALLVELPASEIQRIIDSPNTLLVRHDGIMFFRASGQIAVNVDYKEEETFDTDYNIEGTPSGLPVAALLDGMPMENHSLLEGRLIIDDPDNFSDNYEAKDRIHGTTMSSLIIYGDLEDRNIPISTPLYVRPIMKLRIGLNKREERMPNDELPVDLIHRAVKRIFEGEANNPPMHSIKIINFSIGDNSLLFYHTMSPIAKLLDWLSFRYKVLFIISAGNHLTNVELPITNRDFEALSDIEKEKLIYKTIIADIRNRRLLSPAESLNNITIGSIHHDNSHLRDYDSRINPSLKILPNVHSAFGGGYRNAIKPDLVFSGGRQFFNVLINNNRIHLSYSKNKATPGQSVAAPDPELTKTYFTRGTSNATALITNGAIKITETLKNILGDHYDSPQNKAYIPLLIKVMLAHGSSWGEIETNLTQVLSNSYSNSEIKKIVTKWMGYGMPDIDRVAKCTEQRVTVLGFGELEMDKVHVFKFPLPQSLSAIQGERKLIISLGWFSPIAPRTQRYRIAGLYFEIEDNIIKVNRDDVDWQKVRKGTLQHEVFVGKDAVPFESNSDLKIRVSCKKDAKSFTEPIPYALAVTLEVAEEINLPIYQEVRSRLMNPIVVEQSI